MGLDLQQVLSMLRGVRGPNASGEYTAKCPAHEDHTASLTVTCKASPKDGRRRIYMNCHAGCPNEAVMGALGVTPKDLIVDEDPDRQAGAAKPQRGTGKAAKPQRRTAQPESGPAPDPAGTTETVGGVTVHTVSGKDPERTVDWDHPDKAYSYTDAAGKELFQVVRYHYTNADGKTFIQRRYAPGEAGARRDGYKYSVGAELRDSTVYRLPEVLRAIGAGKPVYIVEGEKDCETLERLGFCATCNAGGAGKWRESQSLLLEGADVIILPDNDPPPRDGKEGHAGQNHAYNVALQLQGIAKRIRLVDLKEACPKLPEKGDISDMVAIMGDVPAMDALARQVTITPEFDPQMVPFWLTPEEQAAQLYGAVPGYGVEDGCIVQKNGDTTKALTDFYVLPRMELIKDDGISTEMMFVLDGWNSKRRKLDRVTIPAGSLDSMDWVTKSWGFYASLTPGSTVKQKVVWVLKKVGQVTAKRVTEYTHSGWRRIGGKWAYLYNGGAIGMDGVTVDMGGALRDYRLDGGGAEGFESIPEEEAARASLSLRGVMKEEIATALLGTMYLAPLAEWLRQTDIPPAFVLFLYGPTGNHKTTAASLALSHYGNFNPQQLPASFNDTGNAIAEKAFALKDMPILVDDFHPVSSQQERRQRDAIAQRLSRSFGDGADRGRLNADRTMQSRKPPRSVAVITGEDLPGIGASGLARFYILDIEVGDIMISDELTELQERARKGVLQKAMRGYITWLLGQTDTLPERLHELFLRFRTNVRQESSGQHDRAPATVAHILLGYCMMLKYMQQELGIFTPDEAAGMLARARDQLLAASRKQSANMESEKPARIFLDALGELLQSRQCSVIDLEGETVKEPIAMDRMIGYKDSQYYYLLPNVAFGAVAELCRKEGTEFPVSLKALYKHLRTDGVFEGITAGDQVTQNKRVTIGGASKVVRAIWIPAALITGTKTSEEQVKMTAVDEPLPDNW